MKVWHFTPYSVEKDLGKAYNEYMSLIGEDDWACIRDGDTMFLTPDFGDIVFNYAYQNPGCVLTCYTNRIHPFAKEQLVENTDINSPNILHQISIAEYNLKTYNDFAYKCFGPLSGFLMLIPKSVWNKVKFKEGVGLLGVDTQFYKDLRAANIPILRMDGLYIWHTYRLGKNIKDTTHLV